MSMIESGDEGMSLEAFAQSVIADIQGMDGADTASAPAEDAATTSDTETDTADAPVGTRDANGRLHGEDGKFVPEGEEQAETESEEEEHEAPEEAEDEPDFVIEVDDEETAAKVEKLLEKYDGDISKALAGAVEAQSLVGKKGSEASQAKAELEAVRAELAEMKALQSQVLTRLSTPTMPITRDLIEQDPKTAAEQAVVQDNPAAFEAAIAAWRNGTEFVDANPEAAELFLQRVVLEAQLAEQAQVAPATQISTTTDTSEVDAEVAKVLQRHPDLEKHLPAIAKAADENPLLKRAMETGSPAEKAQALETLTRIAKAGSAADTSRDALKRVRVQVKQEADEARRSAKVVSANRGSAATGSQPTRVDEFLAAFDARLGLQSDQG